MEFSEGASWINLLVNVCKRSFLLALLLSRLCRAREPSSLSSPFSLPVSSSAKCFPSLFSFGDSKADTGNAQAFFPYESRSEGPPYGCTFFGHPSDRYCDGRLVVDFQAQAYGLPLLSPYGRGLGSDFRHGANFAVSGSACIPDLASSSFYLTRQLSQFRKLKAHYIDQLAVDESYLSPNEYFGGGLYVISTGENDYRVGIVDMGLTAEEIKKQLVPEVINITYATVKGLYEEGAREFMVVGIAADGCISRLLTLLPHEQPQDLDSLGCLNSVNDYVQYHNYMLLQAVKRLRIELTDAHFSYGDYFGVNVDILVNAQTYDGVHCPVKYASCQTATRRVTCKSSSMIAKSYTMLTVNSNTCLPARIQQAQTTSMGFVETLKACCGIGGSYNYNSVVQCGQTGEVEGNNVTVHSCEDPSKYINWDGIHLTEHFYEQVAKAFLQGHFVDQPPILPSSCKLNFSTFSSYSNHERNIWHS